MKFKKPMKTLQVGEILSHVPRQKLRRKTLDKTKKKVKSTSRG